MEFDCRQKVFAFLAEDPVYLEAVRCERVVREVMARIQPTLDEVVGEIVRQRVAQHLELARIMLNEVSLLSDELRQHLDAHRQEEDTADWWKNGNRNTETED